MREHGTHSCYSSGCRCELCELAHNTYTREWHRRKLRESDPTWQPDHRRVKHGSVGMWRNGCRCDACIEAFREYKRQKSYEEGFAHPKVETEIIRPTVACLLSFGVTRKRLAAASGCSAVTLRLKRPTIQRRTARTIEKFHWSAFMASVDFRGHCKCPMSEHIADWLDEKQGRAERMRRAGVA